MMQPSKGKLNRFLVSALIALSVLHFYQFGGNNDTIVVPSAVSTSSQSSMRGSSYSQQVLNDPLSLVAQTSAARSLLDCDPIDSHPVLNSIPSSADNPIRVGVVTSRHPYDNHEGKHFLIDGTIGSDYLALQTICILETMDGCPLDMIQQVASSKFDGRLSRKRQQQEFDDSEIQLWIIDTVRTEMKSLTNNEALVVDPLVESKTYKWKVLLVDYGDKASHGFLKKHNLRPPRLFRKNTPFPHLRYAVRSRIVGRRWDGNNNQKPIQLGEFNARTERLVTRTGDVPIHVPYAVRSDTLAALHQVLPSCNFTRHPISPELHRATRLTGFMHRPPPHTERLMDVIHLWDANDVTYGGVYRSRVSKMVNELDGQSIQLDSTHNVTSSDLSSTTTSTSNTDQQFVKSSTKLHGKIGNFGRSQVDSRYIRALVSSKIVIVTQRDEWEDHYRLMEALIGGAIILHDMMLTLPPWLQNGTSIVFFENLDDLSQKIRYYLQHDEERLAIAERGWMIAMGRHRSWHRMEGAIFGCPLTGVF